MTIDHNAIMFKHAQATQLLRYCRNVKVKQVDPFQSRDGGYISTSHNTSIPLQIKSY